MYTDKNRGLASYPHLNCLKLHPQPDNTENDETTKKLLCKHCESNCLIMKS